MVKSHRHYKQRLDNFEKNKPEQKVLFDQTEIKTNDETHRLDTVGAVVMDRNGVFASAVSSGGILLKHPGRVGHASMFGCGCWVEQDVHLSDSKDEAHSVGICTTGCGEYIIKTLFAKECADHLLNNTNQTDNNLNDFFKKNFLVFFHFS